MSLSVSSPSKPSAVQLAKTEPRGAMTRLYAVLAGLYLAQGIPTYLLLVALPPLMREAGASRTAIGLS